MPRLFGGDPDPLGIAVWDFAGGVNTALWTSFDLAGIVAFATGVPIDIFAELNLDAMMTLGDSSIMFSSDRALG